MSRVRRAGLALLVFVFLASVFSLVLPTPFVPLTIVTNRVLLAVVALAALLTLF